MSGWRALREQAWLAALVIWLPPLLTMLFIAVFSTGVPRELPIGIVDLDHGAEARALQRQLDASPALDLAFRYPSLPEGVEDLRSGAILALLVIPSEFSADLRRALSPQVTLFYNGQFLLSGKFTASAVAGAVADFSVRRAVALRLAQGQQLPNAVVATAPIQPQITPLYNPSMSYTRFLVTAIAPAMWQLLVVIATVLLLHWRLQAPLPAATGPRLRALWQALWPVSLLFWGQALLMLGLFRWLIDWTVAGNVLILAVALGLLVLAIQSMAALIVALIPDVTPALSICAAYLAPAFAFMGVSFPRGDMSSLANLWGSLMPSTHYIQLQIAVADQAAPWGALWPSFLALLAFLLPLPLAIRLLSKRTAARSAT